MIDIDGKVVSLDVIQEHFVCDLHACKGICCVEGDAGAPLTEDEIHILEDIYDDIEPFLRAEGRAAIEKQGQWVIDADREYTTPLVEGKECAYVIFEKGIALCGIEKAYREKKIDFPKPVSCHLYPIRITKYEKFDAVNYDRWPICAPACSCGDKLKIPVYKFVKSALIRKYGDDWYNQLELAVNMLNEQKKKS